MLSPMKKIVFKILLATLLLVSTATFAAGNYWIDKAESGDPRAQYNLGRMYLWGMNELGVERNDQKAYKWFLKSAEQGYAPAQFEVGVSLKNGRGVAADSAKARTWFEKASQQGYRGDNKVMSRRASSSPASASGNTAIPPGEFIGLVAGLSVDSIMQSLRNVQFFNGWWSWWLGAIGLSFVTVGFWYANRVTLGVSSSWDRVVGWRDDIKLAEADKLMRSTPADDLAAALMAETLEEFGDDIPAHMKESLVAGNSSPAAMTAARPERTRWTVHVTFLLSFVAGGFLGYVPAGDWQVRMDMGPDFVRFFGDGPESFVVLLVGGILIGFGTRLGGGCTSGHALSGCSRFQTGSFVGTAAFFGTAIVVSILLDLFLS